MKPEELKAIMERRELTSRDVAALLGHGGSNADGKHVRRWMTRKDAIPKAAAVCLRLYNADPAAFALFSAPQIATAVEKGDIERAYLMLEMADGERIHFALDELVPGAGFVHDGHSGAFRFHGFAQSLTRSVESVNELRGPSS